VTDADLQRAVDALPGQPLDDWLLDADLLGRSALTTAYAVGAETVEFLVGRPELAKFFEACVAAGGDAEGIAKWLRGDVARRFKEEGSLGALSPKNLVDLQSKVVDGTVSWTNARIAFDHMWATGEDPSIVIEQRGLAVVGDEGQLRRIVRDVIAAHPDKVTTYRSGKKGLIGFFMGQVMQATKGRVDPKQANQLVQRALEQPE
jgi:aspartyl-tRNA(Asn)/glutamyl-tRNA(Gln) amidotransferase subunit B